MPVMGDGRWIDERDGACYIHIYVQPRASKNEVLGIHNDFLKIKLTSPPVDGAANTMLAKFLSKLLGVSKSSLEIVSGEKSRNKTVKVKGISLEKVCDLLL